jgi:hypothetical protein
MIDAELLYSLEHPQTEEETIEIIKKHLITEEQKRWLYEQDLTIADILNGRFMVSLESQVNKILESWNDKIGKHVFGF